MRLSRNLTIAMSLLAGIFYVSVRNAAADQLGFAVDATGSLYSVDLTTATATPIGSTGQLLEGLAISPQGSLFGTDFLGNLFSVSRTTGAATLIGNTGVGDIEGLSFNGTTLIGTNFSNLGGPTTVYAINTTTAVPTAVTSFSQGPVRAMAVVNPNTIDVASDSPVSQSLVQVNLAERHEHGLGATAQCGCGAHRRAQFRQRRDALCSRPVRKRVHHRQQWSGHAGRQYRRPELARSHDGLDHPPRRRARAWQHGIASNSGIRPDCVRAWQRSGGSAQS